jgi:predicted component of type VI protein secretion system
MRSALDEVLSRFDPVGPNNNTRPRAYGGILSRAAVRAKLWTQFGAQHAQILREAEDDFDFLSGRAFREAHETQLATLARPISERRLS